MFAFDKDKYYYGNGRIEIHSGSCDEYHLVNNEILWHIQHYAAIY